MPWARPPKIQDGPYVNLSFAVLGSTVKDYRNGKPLARRLIREWIKTGNAHLYLEICGTSADWLLSSLGEAN